MITTRSALTRGHTIYRGVSDTMSRISFINFLNILISSFTRGSRSRNRGVSEALSYTLALGILGMLVTGLLLQGGAVFNKATEQSMQDQAEFEAERVAAAIEEIDRQARASNTNRTISTTIDLPDDIAGQGYYVEVQTTSTGGTVRVFAPQEDIVAETEVMNRTKIQADQIQGGRIRIVREAGGESITIQSDDRV